VRGWHGASWPVKGGKVEKFGCQGLAWGWRWGAGCSCVWAQGVRAPLPVVGGEGPMATVQWRPQCVWQSIEPPLMGASLCSDWAW
jgi:hypothetical protein